MAPNAAKSHYAAASRVPLIQSPSLRVPRPVEYPMTRSLGLHEFLILILSPILQVELPPGIHPLPESVNAYVSSRPPNTIRLPQTATPRLITI